MARRPKRRPSPDRKRLAELESRVFALGQELARREGELAKALAGRARAVCRAAELDTRLRSLRRIVFAQTPVDEREPPTHGN